MINTHQSMTNNQATEDVHPLMYFVKVPYAEASVNSQEKTVRQTAEHTESDH